jgi:hypothetical protein
MSAINTGIAIDENVLNALDQWANEEYRSRNNLIQLLLAQAVRRREAAQRAAASTEPAPQIAIFTSCVDEDMAI